MSQHSIPFPRLCSFINFLPLQKIEIWPELVTFWRHLCPSRARGEFTGRKMSTSQGTRKNSIWGDTAFPNCPDRKTTGVVGIRPPPSSWSLLIKVDFSSLQRGVRKSLSSIAYSCLSNQLRPGIPSQGREAARKQLWVFVQGNHPLTYFNSIISYLGTDVSRRRMRHQSLWQGYIKWRDKRSVILVRVYRKDQTSKRTEGQMALINTNDFSLLQFPHHLYYSLFNRTSHFPCI